MILVELSQDRARLLTIKYVEIKGGGLALLVLDFEGSISIALTVDRDTDELAWCDVPNEELPDLGDLVPSVSGAYGLFLTWSWQMRNHQGYFDAVQLEFTDVELGSSIIFQIKAAASVMRIFQVNESTVYTD